MSKNISRKGIAFGALVALGSSLIAVAPAHAANELVFEPTAGTTYNTFVTGDFALAASLAPGQVAGNITQLKYEIVGGANAALHYKTGAIVEEATVPTANTAANSQVISAGAVAGTRSVLNIGLAGAIATTATKAVTVTAFIDSDNDNIVDSGEFQQARTINFIKHSEVTPSVSFTSPAEGDLALVSSVSLGNINVEQLGAGLKVKYAATSGAIGAAEANGVAADANGLFKDAVTGVDANDVITAQVKFAGADIGSVVSKTVPARTIGAPTAALLAGANATALGVARIDGAFQAAATIRSTSTGTPLKAGESVVASVALTGAELGAGRSVTFNGVVYTTKASLAAATATVSSDAKGLATVNLSTSGLTAGVDSLVVSFKAQNYVAQAAVSFETATFTSVDSTDKSGSVDRSIVEGSSSTLTFEVKDQFGVAISDPSRLAFTVDGDASAQVISYVNLVGGKASIKVADTTADASTFYAVDAELQIQESDGNFRAPAVAVPALQHTVHVSNAALVWNGTSTGAAGVMADATSSGVDVFGVLSEVATLVPVAAGGELSVNNPGAQVTVSSPGVTFVVNDIEYNDSVTVFSDAAGDLAIEAKSSIAGVHVITYTAGSDIRTGKFTVAKALETSATTITLTAPAKVLPGGVLVVSGKLTDKYGNPVDTDSVQTTGASFSVAYTDNGQGVIIGQEPVQTDGDGKFNLRYSIAANQSGTAVVTVKYDADNTGTASAEISASKTVIINKSSTASASAGSKKITVRAKNSLGETVKVYVDGVLKSTKVATSNNYAITVSGLTAGKHTVKVLVSGKSVLNTRVVATK